MKPAGGERLDVDARLAVVAAALLVLVGAAVRVACARDGLWLDEAWSIIVARHAPSARALLTLLHHDNNHVLNSWILRAMDDVTAPLLLRLPSLVAGTISIAVAGVLTRARGRVEMLVAMGLIAVSFPLVQYSSEARGYSLAILFSLLAWTALRSHLERPRLVLAAVFWACCVLGMLSHLTFVLALAGLVPWSLATWYRAGGAPLAMREGLRCHALPGLITLGLLAMLLPDMVVGGGPVRSAWDVLVAALSLAVGGPREGALAWAIAALVVLIGALLGAEGWRARRGNLEWTLFAGTCVAGPLLLLMLARTDFLAERYFVIPMTFGLLLLARLIALGLSAGGVRRLAATAALLFVLGGGALADAKLALLGRGSPLKALEFIARDSQGAPATVMSSNDFRGQLLIRWHLETGGAALTYLPVSRTSEEPARWWLVEEFDESATAPHHRRMSSGARYELVATFPHSGLSGWTWLAYRRTDRP